MDPLDVEQRTFRVTVRGQFRNLSEQSRRYLVGAQPEHDIFVSGYTAEGTFTYDERIAFFNLRYELRCTDAESAADAGLHEARRFLETMAFGYDRLRVNVVDVGAMWADDPRRRPIDS
jgi:Family of unknown function (DUF6204)